LWWSRRTLGLYFPVVRLKAATNNAAN